MFVSFETREINASCSFCLPGLGSADGEGTTGRVVFGPGLHTAGITAVVGLRQAEAAQDLSSSCETNGNMKDNLETDLWLYLYTMSCANTDTSHGHVLLTKPGQVLLLLGLGAISIDWMHDE